MEPKFKIWKELKDQVNYYTPKMKLKDEEGDWMRRNSATVDEIIAEKKKALANLAKWVARVQPLENELKSVEKQMEVEEGSLRKALTAANDNTTNKFRVQLPYTHQLEGNWEVALVEIIYPYSWDNVPSGKEESIEQSTNCIELCHSPEKDPTKVYIPPGHYSSIKALNNSISKTIWKALVEQGVDKQR